MGRVLVEICCESTGDALCARENGADRIELCSALALGGLTPSAGTLELTRRSVDLPIMALIRPRAGGFHYSASEFETLKADVDRAIEAGADGIVLGVLKADGSIDVSRCRELRQQIGAHESVFHRAFDVTPDPFRALEELIDLGFTRILTSGQRNKALEGASLIRELVERAGARIEILPGSGITPENASQLIARTGCNQIHASASRMVRDTARSERRSVSLGVSAQVHDEYREADGAMIKALAKLVRQDLQ